ncbi:hypothetical protein LTR84_011734 [Exophiala bonariae]|uniref:Uncharacterized protein n=1 Tax=Exophiala bonariae TaxID=1690606 RepID=A0AAV9NH05_9EURO|nr:hypothetical protein LTR84_011734 [Exophiala bonariae]
MATPTQTLDGPLGNVIIYACRVIEPGSVQGFRTGFDNLGMFALGFVIGICGTFFIVALLFEIRVIWWIHRTKHGPDDSKWEDISDWKVIVNAEEGRAYGKCEFETEWIDE